MEGEGEGEGVRGLAEKRSRGLGEVPFLSVLPASGWLLDDIIYKVHGVWCVYLLEPCIRGDAGDLLSHTAQDVEAVAVAPVRARLVQQRHLAQHKQ